MPRYPRSKLSLTDLERIVTEFRDGILDCTQFQNKSKGMCFLVCSPLQSYLSSQHYFFTKLIKADFGFSNHVWLEMQSGDIIDPTADQFPEANLPTVYIGKMPAIYTQWMTDKLKVQSS